MPNKMNITKYIQCTNHDSGLLKTMSAAVNIHDGVRIVYETENEKQRMLHIMADYVD